MAGVPPATLRGAWSVGERWWRTRFLRILSAQNWAAPRSAGNTQGKSPFCFERVADKRRQGPHGLPVPFSPGSFSLDRRVSPSVCLYCVPAFDFRLQLLAGLGAESSPGSSAHPRAHLLAQTLAHTSKSGPRVARRRCAAELVGCRGSNTSRASGIDSPPVS